MTLRLIVMRHAKSSWDTPTAGDHDRPLNDRGRAAAASLGNWLARKGYLPDLVLSSDALRTQETWVLVSDALSAQPRVEWNSALYLAGAQAMLEVLRTAKSAQCVLMLGHNPGIARFADMLVALPPDHISFRDYPTAATTVIDIPAPQWDTVDWRIGTVVDFVVPRDL